jgi:hypothetical protein
MRELWILLIFMVLLSASPRGLADDASLPQSVQGETESLIITVHYPDGWRAVTDDLSAMPAVMLVSDEALLDSESGAIPEEGAIRLSLMALQRTDMLAAHRFAANELDDEEVLQAVLSSFTSLTVRANGRTAYGPAEALTIDERLAVRATASLAEGDGLLLLVDYAAEDVMLLIYGLTAADEMNDFIHLIDEIAAEVEFAALPPDPDATDTP